MSGSRNSSHGHDSRAFGYPTIDIASRLLTSNNFREYLQSIPDKERNGRCIIPHCGRHNPSDANARLLRLGSHITAQVCKREHWNDEAEALQLVSWINQVSKDIIRNGDRLPGSSPLLTRTHELRVECGGLSSVGKDLTERCRLSGHHNIWVEEAGQKRYFCCGDHLYQWVISDDRRGVKRKAPLDLATSLKQLIRPSVDDENLIAKVRPVMNSMEEEFMKTSNPADWANHKRIAAKTLQSEGISELGEGKYDQARSYFTLCISLDPSYTFYSNRATAYTKLGYYEKVIADADQMIRLQPLEGKGYIRKAEAYFHLEKFERSLEEYNRGLSKEPTNVHLNAGKQQVKKKLAQRYNDIGKEFKNQGKLSEALDNFANAIENDPGQHAFLKNRYQVHMALENREEALEDIDKYIVLKPNTSKGCDLRGKALRGLGRYKDAEKEERRAQELRANGN